MHKLGLHHLSAIETDPVSFVAIAAQTGCQRISVFTRQPGDHSAFPLVTRANKPGFVAALREGGIEVAGIESFLLTPVTGVQAFEPALELGAELGARYAGAQLFDNDESRVVENLSALCDMAARLELQVAVEFMPLSPAWKTLAEVTALVARVAHPALAIGIDTLHLFRSGGSPDDVAALAPGLAGYAQLCDSADLSVTSDYAAEAVGNRLAPGDGVFPLAAFLRALPRGTALELEVPQPARQPALERVRHAVAGARKLIEAA